VFAVPSGTSWPLPLYELALLSAARARARRAAVAITLVSPEPRPLAAFGAAASELVAAELADRGVRFLGSSAPRSACGGGALTVQSGPPINADRVVAVPQLRGAKIAGIPANRQGFVPTDAAGRIEGTADVYAAGDTTAFPIKHGRTRQPAGRPNRAYDRRQSRAHTARTESQARSRGQADRR
jgi:sulfide:quinone oxidoreductase